MRERTPAIYILASQRRGTIYIGVTSDPLGRWWQHREKQVKGFTSRYGVTRLVYVEFFGDMEHAILREKQLKRWHRDWKINLIEAVNPTWRDLRWTMASSRSTRRGRRAWMLKRVQHDGGGGECRTLGTGAVVLGKMWRVGG